MLPTYLFILYVEPADGGSSRKNLIPGYWVDSLDRLPTDVHACDTIRIRFEAAAYTFEVPPIPTVLAADVSASWACLTRVLGWDLNQWYSELAGFVGECMAEESVGYPVRLSSTLATQLSFPSSELVEAFDGDCCVVLSSEISQLFGEEPSVCANIVALSPAEFSEFESCFSTMPILVSVFLQFGSAVLVSDLVQRYFASKVELLQDAAVPFVHHGDSNAIGVLVYADHILRGSRGWRSLLEQHEETVATGHQDACSNPTVSQMLLQPPVCSIALDGEPEPFMVSTNAQHWMSTLWSSSTRRVSYQSVPLGVQF